MVVISFIIYTVLITKQAQYLKNITNDSLNVQYEYIYLLIIIVLFYIIFITLKYFWVISVNL